MWCMALALPISNYSWTTLNSCTTRLTLSNWGHYCLRGEGQIMYYYSQTTQKDIALAQITCLVCNTLATMKLFKHSTWRWIIIMPWWSTTYYATCGNCFSTLKIDKQIMKQVERGIVMQSRGYLPDKRCKNCGANIDTNQRFCANCGVCLQ